MDQLKLLTISIPTYNRVEPLKRTLRLLLPQLTDKCFLRILDNCSEIPVESYAVEIIRAFPKVTFEIIRNKINIGGDSNIIRCFELCETKWIWTLGDDDEIQPDAIQVVLNDIDKYFGAVNINYYSPHKFHPVRNNSKVIQGRLNYIKEIDSFGASIFISVNVYNMTLLKNVWLSNNNTYSCSSHWLIIYYSLSAQSITVQSDKVICLNTFHSENYSNFNLTVVKGFATILDIYTSREEKKALIGMLRTVTREWLTIDGIVKSLLIDYMKSGKILDPEFSFNKIYNGFYKYFGIKIKIKYLIYQSMIHISPLIAFKIIRLLYLKRKGLDINHYIIS